MRRLLSLVPLALAGCDITGPCGSDVMQVARDPGSDRYAILENRDCGATTTNVTVVRVGRASEWQSNAVEVFVADDNHGEAALGRGGTIWTNVVWTGPGRLLINYASKARTFKREIAAKGATVSYRATEPFALPPVP
ncbi:hypothetical protein [Sphingomonas immobilis]|uniref:Lipoprotein n=1 Tax=Sphingomonas immobilis TaxID=3063997 RepID=A0ABT9A2N6_9SPHN|nr:hypothetical protein [Sphingomonas sp. CA1-15]MDO7844075.1 hypothetical protein [Sphingomonas sp. CA1-15]